MAGRLVRNGAKDVAKWRETEKFGGRSMEIVHCSSCCDGIDRDDSRTCHHWSINIVSVFGSGRYLQCYINITPTLHRNIFQLGKEGRYGDRRELSDIVSLSSHPDHVSCAIQSGRSWRASAYYRWELVSLLHYIHHEFLNNTYYMHNERSWRGRGDGRRSLYKWYCERACCSKITFTECHHDGKHHRKKSAAY